jgi:hypothetical protein
MFIPILHEGINAPTLSLLLAQIRDDVAFSMSCILVVVPPKNAFPKIGHWGETRDTLHAYCKVIGAIRAAFTPEQPRYQHVNLRLYTAGLTTTPIPHPADAKRNFSLSLDLRNHYVLLSTSEGEVHQTRMSEGLTATKLGNALLDKLAELGVEGKVNKTKYENEDERGYALDAAERYFSALSQTGRIFEAFRNDLPGEKDPVQFWPHHFDLSFVVLGSKQVTTVEGTYPSQITVGFAPDDQGQPTPYFYVNPFPFEETIKHQKLPEGAVWHTALWQGALLPYTEVAETPDAEARILEFLRGAYQAEKAYI